MTRPQLNGPCLHETAVKNPTAMRKTKTTALATLLIAALALTGCSRNNNQILIRLRGPEVSFGSEPLVVQVSKDSIAYIWQFSDKLAIPDSDALEGKNVPASTLADVQPQATLYKQAQDQQNKPAPVIIAGDSQGECGAIFEAIANAKRAGITTFYFETFYRGPGRTNSQMPGEVRIPPPRLFPSEGIIGESAKTNSQVLLLGQLEDPALCAKLLGNPVTITISKDISKDNTYAFAWDNRPMTFDDLLKRLFEVRKTVQDGSIHFIIEVEAQIDFNLLRNILYQIQWSNNEKSITIELRQIK